MIDSEPMSFLRAIICSGLAPSYPYCESFPSWASLLSASIR